VQTTNVSDNNKQYRYILVLLLWSQIVLLCCVSGKCLMNWSVYLEGWGKLLNCVLDYLKQTGEGMCIICLIKLQSIKIQNSHFHIQTIICFKILLSVSNLFSGKTKYWFLTNITMFQWTWQHKDFIQIFANIIHIRKPVFTDSWRKKGEILWNILLFIFLTTHSLTPWSRVLLEKQSRFLDSQ
jgi:hypothetical protein